MNKILPLVLMILFGLISCKKSDKKSSNQPIDINLEEYSLGKLDSLHVRRNMKDYDRTLEEYILSKPNVVTESRNVIYLMPFGNISPLVDSIIREEVDYLEKFFQLQVKILPRVTFEEILKNGEIKTRKVVERDFDVYSKMKGAPQNAENFREQIQATSFMKEYLLKNKPADAVALIGITEHDIYNPGYHYLFGNSSLKDGVGVVSTYRIVDYGFRPANTIRKVTSKQIVNLFSIKNVKDYKCLLNFHNNAIQQANGEFKLSPRALEKLKYAVGFDYNKRFADLEEFWRNHDNQELANYYKKAQE